MYTGVGEIPHWNKIILPNHMDYSEDSKSSGVVKVKT